MNLTDIGKQLKRVIGTTRLQSLGREMKFEERTARRISTEGFVRSLLCSLGTRKVESIADVHRDYCKDNEVNVNYKPYYDRLDKPGFPEMMRTILGDMMSHMVLDVLTPAAGSPLNAFEDIIIHDGCSFALADGLADVFPGRFTKNSPAAIELHATMSLRSDNLTVVVSAPDKECERHFAPDPADLKNCLGLMDRGYDGRPFMQAIDDAGGSFLIRIRSQLDPVVVKIHRPGKKYRKLEGRRLSVVTKSLPKSKRHDLDVAWFRPSGERQHSFRLVTTWHDSKGEWIRLMTNLERKQFPMTLVLATFRLRWQVELAFKEMKSYSNLHRFQTGKRFIAEGLFWASLCVCFLKRYLAHGCQLVSGSHALSTRRTSMCGHQILPPLFDSLRRGTRSLSRVLAEAFAFLETHARRSNPRRERERGRLAPGIVPVGVAS